MKKTLKRRTFISAIAMLIVSAIVLTSSTFAWFSMARQVEVEEMQLTVTSPDGILLSANTANWTTLLDVDDLNPPTGYTSRFMVNADTNTNNFPTLLKPSSSNLSLVGSATRLPKFFEGSTNASGALTVKQVTDDVSSGYVAFDVFIKLGKEQPVYWNKTTVTAVAKGNEEVLYATRVAVVNCGSSLVPEEAETIHEGKEIQMFEPRAYSHLEALGLPEEPVQTKAFIQPITGTDISGTGYVYTGDSYYIAAATPKVQANENNKTGMQMTLPEGITRLRVYLWLEGQDVDCLESIGGSQFNFNLVFSLDP